MASEDISQLSSTSLTFRNPDSVKYRAESYHRNFTSRLVQYRQRERFTDVVLKCKNLELPCHKVALAAASSYFDAILDGKVKESKSEVVELKTLSPDILSTIVDFIYTAEVTLTDENVKKLCSACDELQLKELKEGCDEFMSQRVEPFNCLGLYVFSKHHDLELTLRESRNCMMTRLTGILQLALDQEFKVIEEDHVIEYISSDDLEVEDEAKVFEFVEKWVGVNPSVREGSIDNIMEHVRFAFCSPVHLCSVIEKSPLMQSKKCLLLLLEAKTYQFVPEQRPSIESARTKPRKGNEEVLLLDGDNSSQGKCWYLEQSKREWKEFTTLPVSGLRYFRSCFSGNDIILTGGYFNNNYTNAAWAFDLSDKKWQALPSMIDSRGHHAVVSAAGEIYVLGGYGKGGAHNRVEKLDAKRQGWKQLAPMLLELSYHLAVQIGENIFVMACESGKGSQITQAYNLSSGTWHLRADMPQPCRYASAVHFNDKIYVVGGNEKCCMSYDPRQNVWSTHAQPGQARNTPAAVVWKGKILLCGGRNRKDIEEYDVEKDKWTAWSESLPAAMFHPAMLTVRALKG